MTFTKEQMEALAPYEDNFRTAVNNNWSRYPGAGNLRTIFRIWKEASGTRLRMNYGCSRCILHLLQDVGKVYFETVDVKKKLADAKEKLASAETPKKSPAKAKKKPSGTTPKKKGEKAVKAK